MVLWIPYPSVETKVDNHGFNEKNGVYPLGTEGWQPWFDEVHIHPWKRYGKREADAEPEAKADPYLLYGGYGHGYAGHLGYAGHYGYPYAGYAYYG